MNLEPRRSRPSSRLVSPKDSRMASRWQLATLVILVGTIMVIGLVVWLTPLEPIEQGDVPAGNLPVGNLPANGQSSKPATLELADKPANLSAQQLLQLLEDLATELQRRHPKSAAAYHFSAQICASTNQANEAELLWRRCLEIQPDHVGAQLGIADLMIAAGRDEEAIALLESTRQRQGDTVELLIKLGESNENLGELENAQKYLGLCTEKFPTVNQAWLALGRVQNQLGQFMNAESSIRRAKELGASSEAVLFALATALTRQKKDAEATEVRRQLEELQAQDRQRKQFQDSYEQTLRSLASRMLDSAAVFEEQYGDLSKATEYALKSIQIQPDILQNYMTLASIQRRLGNLEDVIQIQERLLQLQPDNILNYMNLASVVLKSGDIEKAESILQQAAERDPKGTLAQSAQVQLWLASGKLDQAKALAQVILERKTAPESLELMASVHEASNETEKAIEYRRQAASLRAQQSVARPTPQ